MQSLLELALNNSNFLNNWKNNVKLSEHHVALFNLIEKKTEISVNVYLLDCLEICDIGFVKSMYQVAEEEINFANEFSPKPNPYTIDDMLKARFGIFYKKRIAFDSKFDDHKNFKYTALNLTSKGLIKYGNFCINFNRFKVQVTFLAKESLKYFIDEDTFDEANFQVEISTNEDLPKLFLRKHFDEIENNTFNIENACSERSYIEGIVVNDLTINDIETINIEQEKYDAFFETYFKRFSEKLDEQEKIVLRQFIKLNTILKQKGLRLNQFQ